MVCWQRRPASEGTRLSPRERWVPRGERVGPADCHRPCTTPWNRAWRRTSRRAKPNACSPVVRASGSLSQVRVMSILSPRVLLPYMSRLAPLVHDEHMERGWKSLALEMPCLNDKIPAHGLNVILVTASLAMSRADKHLGPLGMVQQTGVFCGSETEWSGPGGRGVQDGPSHRRAEMCKARATSLPTTGSVTRLGRLAVTS